MSSRSSFNFGLSTAMACCVLLLNACAAEPPEPAKIENTREVTATVESIDVATRMLTLRNAEGESFTFQAAPEIRNLPQVKVGDKVVARYYEALAAQLRRRGDGTGETEAPVVEAAVGRAALGEKPAAAIGTQTTQTVRVTAIDKKNHVVNFYGSDGLARSLPVRTPQGQEFVSKLKVGDEVELTYTEAIALSVETAK